MSSVNTSILSKSFFVGLMLTFQLSAAVAAPADCPTDSDHAILSAFGDRIASADSPEAARGLALRQTRLARVAISRASLILPGDAEVMDAEARFATFEREVASSRSQSEVSKHFYALGQEGLPGQSRTGDTQSAANCDYTNGEIVIIIIGFILGILPGILFLFLFC